MIRIALDRCYEQRDFKPAKTLMNMTSTFFYPRVHRTTGEVEKIYVQVDHVVPISAEPFSFQAKVRDHPIWRDLQYWEEIFFGLVPAGESFMFYFFLAVL